MRKLSFRGQRSRRWYLVVPPAVLVAAIICAVGLIIGLDTSVTPPAVGAEPSASLGEPAQTGGRTAPDASGADTTTAPASAQEGAGVSMQAGLCTWNPDELPTVDVDVLVFSTQTSGLAAVRELALSAPHLKVALVSAGNLMETPLAQGLSVEDARNIGQVAGGFYREWRQAVIDSYGQRGLSAFTSSGRLVYEPEVAVEALWSLLGDKDGEQLSFYSAHLLAASDEGEQRYADVRVEGSGLLRINTRYFIDASVEGDLLRMLGADYRVGRHEAVYNDVARVMPVYPSAANDYETAPQRFSALLTLKVYKGVTAPRIAQLDYFNYDPSTYAQMGTFSQKNVDAFKSSWSMTIAVLPNGKRELNEGWSDWPDVGLAFQWIFAPEKRGEIRKRVVEWAVNRVRYLQEHGYPRVGIATIPQKLYVREGPRVLGLDTYTVDELRGDIGAEAVALGCYCEYDRHDAFYPNHVEQTRYARVPLGALMAAGHPWLLVSTGVSVDYQTYSSAVRMEHTRAAMGGAAGAIVAVADRLGVDPQQVAYADVRAHLLERGYRLDVAP